jgi:hypothetical protein
MPTISYGSLDLSLRACAESGGPLSGGGAGLSQMLMCQMLTGTAWTKEMSRPTASVGDKMVMMDQFSHWLSGILDGFVPETGRPLGHGRFATACRIGRRLRL